MSWKMFILATRMRGRSSTIFSGVFLSKSPADLTPKTTAMPIRLAIVNPKRVLALMAASQSLVNPEGGAGGETLLFPHHRLTTQAPIGNRHSDESQKVRNQRL